MSVPLDAKTLLPPFHFSLVLVSVCCLVPPFASPVRTMLSRWQLLCEEIKAMSHPMLSYIEELDVLEGLNRTVSTLLCRYNT